MQEEIKRRFNSGNACYRSVQNLLSSPLLSKNIKIIIYKTLLVSWQWIYQSHCNFKSHVKYSWHHIIPFLPFLWLPIPRLDSTTAVYSAVLCLLPLLSCRTLLITTLHGPHGKHVSSVRICDTDHIENTASSIVAKACLPCHCLATEVFVVAGMCLATRFLAIDVLLLRACVLQEYVYRPIA
jgi:hypothetical protein